MAGLEEHIDDLEARHQAHKEERAEDRAEHREERLAKEMGKEAADFAKAGTATHTTGEYHDEDKGFREERREDREAARIAEDEDKADEAANRCAEKGGCGCN